jgi:TPP-dependent pyruvate/acetoin dehydrogenase alpha subunit
VLAIDDAAKAEMVRAVAFALDSPYPQPEEAFDHVFA